MFEFDQLELANDGNELTAWYRLTAHHPGFQGHFPNHPILPAVSHLALVQALIGDRWGGINGGRAIKFYLQLTPGDKIEIRTRHLRSGEIRFRVLRNGALASKGILLTVEE